MELQKYCGLSIIFMLLLGCGGGPSTPASNLPPSASDLDILGLTRLCDTKSTVGNRLKNQVLQQKSWGNGDKWLREKTDQASQPLKQWLFFNKDEILVAVVSAYPDGLPLKPYPVLRETLSQLQPAREFFINANSLIRGNKPDTVQLFRTGDEKTTTQYVVKQDEDQNDQLLVAVVVLDPYEQLLDGAQQQFLTSSGRNSDHKQPQSRFLALQQFARGEIALFESCPGEKPTIAIDAYREAIRIGLNDDKLTAEAHHRLGLALRLKGQLSEARSSIDESLKIKPHSPRVLNSLGIVLSQLKKHSQAIAALEKAIALQPNYARARFNLAEAYEMVNPRRSIEEYETYLALVDNIPEEATRVALAKSRLEKLK